MSHVAESGAVLVSSSVVNCTNKLVQEFLKLKRVPNERGLKKSRIEILKKRIESGDFAEIPQWVRCTVNGKVYRVNGQHTSAVFNEIGIPPGQKVLLVDYTASDLKQLSRLWGNHDNSSVMRTIGEKIFAAAGAHRSLTSVPQCILTSVISGIRYSESVDKVALSMPIDYVGKNTEFITFYNENFPMLQTSKQFRLRSVVASIFDTWSVNRTAAKKFWTLVKDESDVAGSPTRFLADFLKTKADHHNKEKTVYYCFSCWNSFRENAKKMRDLKWSEKAIISSEGLI